MNLQSISKEEKYYYEEPRSGTTLRYKQGLLNMGCLTFSINVFKKSIYIEKKRKRNILKHPRVSSKIPNILFSRYKFGNLKNIT